MLRAFASRVGRKYFSTLKATPYPPVENSAPVERWTIKNLQYPTKVPQSPLDTIYDGNRDNGAMIINQHTIRLLERLSLVDLDSKEAIQTLQDSIEFASRILTINTDGIEPLYCVLEYEKLALRFDVVDDGDIQADVLRNAAIVEEEYFVAPPGNIPLEQGEHLPK